MRAAGWMSAPVRLWAISAIIRGTSGIPWRWSALAMR